MASMLTLDGLVRSESLQAVDRSRRRLNGFPAPARRKSTGHLTLSAQDPASIAAGHGIGAAREWIKSQFERYSKDAADASR